jgi:hypothetical protein
VPREERVVELAADEVDHEVDEESLHGDVWMGLVHQRGFIGVGGFETEESRETEGEGFQLGIEH